VHHPTRHLLVTHEAMVNARCGLTEKRK